MKRPFFTSLLLTAAVLLGALAGTGRAAASSSYQSHWTECISHLDDATMTHVVRKTCTRYAMPKAPQRQPSSWTQTRTRVSPHVIVGIHFPSWAPPCSINPAVGPNVTRWAPTICSVSAQTGISSRILAAVIFVESSGYSCVASTDGYGSIGLMQLIPTTAASVMGVSVAYAASALCNPTWNVMAGAYYIRQLLGYMGSMTGALAAFNGGPGDPQYGYASKVLSYA